MNLIEQIDAATAKGESLISKLDAAIERAERLVGKSEPEPIPADKEPEPAKSRREWVLSRQVGKLDVIAKDGDLLTPIDRIRVREVLPGDPTIEQVQALVDACQGWARVPFHEALAAALQPFTRKDKP